MGPWGNWCMMYKDFRASMCVLRSYTLAMCVKKFVSWVCIWFCLLFMRFCVCLCVFVRVCVCLCVGSVCVRGRYAVGGPSGLGLASPASTECWEDELAKRRLHLLCLPLLLLLLLFLLFLLLFRGGVTDLFGERGPVWQTRLQVCLPQCSETWKWKRNSSSKVAAIFFTSWNAIVVPIFHTLSVVFRWLISWGFWQLFPIKSLMPPISNMY